MYYYVSLTWPQTDVGVSLFSRAGTRLVKGWGRKDPLLLLERVDSDLAGLIRAVIAGEDAIAPLTDRLLELGVDVPPSLPEVRHSGFEAYPSDHTEQIEETDKSRLAWADDLSDPVAPDCPVCGNPGCGGTFCGGWDDYEEDLSPPDADDLAYMDRADHAF